MLTKSAQIVQDILQRKGVDFNVLELPDSTRTAKEAAKTIGCTVAQIVKSLIFQTTPSKMPILVLASGPNQVNEKIFLPLLGEKVEKADAKFVKEITGFSIGGVPPVGHKNPIETFIDEDLLEFADLWAAAGTPNAVFRLDSKTLVNLTNGKVISIK